MQICRQRTLHVQIGVKEDSKISCIVNRMGCSVTNCDSHFVESIAEVRRAIYHKFRLVIIHFKFKMCHPRADFRHTSRDF